MPRTLPCLMATVVSVSVILGDTAVSAQDKYSLKSPSGIAFSDFKGYEDWAVVSSARTDEVLKVIVANPTMIEAYKALGEYGGKGVMLGFIKQTGMLPQSLQKEFDRYYPTGYSSSSPNEFFAETYALRFYGNEAEKNHPAVKLMDALLKTIYPTLN